MSEENVEAVRAVYEQWSEGHFRAAVELFDPYVVLVLPPGFLDAGRISAPKQLRSTQGACWGR